jgi:two-component system, chemotaxis family, protein-glutamate methylesterase/glutaminase
MPYDFVVIGASVGGLEAVSLLLRQLPPDFSLPIAIVQHRAPVPPDGDLAGIWQRSTALPIADAEDKVPIEPRHVYVAPADYHLLVESRNLFALSTDPPVLWARPSIDVLFESAADAYGDGVIGVILTGASADGSQGLKAIRDRGGCALVQEPATAECDVMPRAALAATSVNHVVALPDLGRILAALAGTVGGGARR